MELLGLAEIAGLLGVTKQVVANWRARKSSFPKPMAELRSGPVWHKTEIVAWAEAEDIPIVEPDDHITDPLDGVSRRAIVAALMNMKGGVGKTTLTVNIAAALAEQGSRVLLVDSDPQCNLTSYLIEDKVVDELLDKSDKASGRTLWTALKPIVEASGGVSEIEPYERGGLFLLPGDIRLSEFESVLNDFWGDCVQRKVRGFRGTSDLLPDFAPLRLRGSGQLPA